MRKPFVLFVLLGIAVAVYAQTPASTPVEAGPQTVDTVRIDKRRTRQPFNPNEPVVHDPVIIHDGTCYHLFATGMGISHMTSSDLKTWKPEKRVFQQSPEWIQRLLPDFKGHIWAPDIIFYQGRYHLFYSCSAFAKNTSVIGHASISSLQSPDSVQQWTDHGPVVQSVPNRDLWNAIDPNILVDESGTPWMTFGSFWGGIKLVKLTSDLMAVEKPEVWYTLCRRPRSFNIEDTNPGDGAVEAPFLFRHGDYYYLFVSYDYCCRGLKSDYYVVVGRSRRVTGPYLDREGKSMDQGGGSVILKGDERWAAAGHCAVYRCDNTDYFVAHGYSKSENGASKLLVRIVEWDNEGWPLLTE